MISNEVPAPSSVQDPTKTDSASTGIPKTISSTQIAAKFITPAVHEEVMHNGHIEETSVPKRVICIAVDDSLPSQYAVTWTLEHLATRHDQVCLLNVRPYAIPGYVLGSTLLTGAGGPAGEFLPLSSSSNYEFSEEYVDALERCNRDASHDLLTRFGAQVVSKGVQCRAVALRGDAREEILAKLAQLKPDMLVCGCRGLGFLQKAFKGSLSDYLVQHAECVVIVPKMK